MNEVCTCEQCGALLDSTAPEGLCPRCVLVTVASDAIGAPVAQVFSPAGSGGIPAARSDTGQE